MQLFLHLGTDLEYFKLLNEGFLLPSGKEQKEIAAFFSRHFPGELAENISPQYEVNFQAIKELKRKFGPDVFKKIDGIYYGSDNCEYLIPHVHEVKKALEYFAEFNKNFPPHAPRSFTLVTPYVGDKMLEHLKKTLTYLHEVSLKKPIEIVVNDLWVLKLIHENFPKLRITFGRLIHKILKTPLIDTYGYDVHPSGELIRNKSAQEIEAMKKEIVKWQLKFYASSESSLPVYQKFLHKHSIDRITIDYMEKREDLYKNYDDIGVDLYYPWALVFTGRLCDTSAVENPARGYYATDDVCPRTCHRIDVFYKVKTIGYHLIQRGNSAYRSECNLDYLSQSWYQNPHNRLIFSPFIPV